MEDPLNITEGKNLLKTQDSLVSITRIQNRTQSRYTFNHSNRITAPRTQSYPEGKLWRGYTELDTNSTWA